MKLIKKGIALVLVSAFLASCVPPRPPKRPMPPGAAGRPAPPRPPR
ncbi:hypothetical protein [Chryseobacterium sp. Leaf180]|nr:hypothetical protein [Chryseobacterium sp. Leaf180]